MNIDTLLQYLLYFYAVCCVAGLIETAKEVFKYGKMDLQDRRDYVSGKRSYFSPSLTVGFVFGNLMLALIPVVNIYILLGEFLPSLLYGIKRIGHIPLIPIPKKPEPK